ncbi:large conductance mechanosensitive channel protein MscL [Nocardioidaceae bacterium SCSIO 66511]|nr:large conductance mechanosensitive channel protein MscL [Nocardioidaceae bacterium SCSIO 66511]
MLKGFKDFIMRGNLVELAVAFVIGVAFAAVVTSLVDNIIMPLVGKIGGQPDFSGIEVAEIPVGQFINDLVAFLIIAAAVYFLVVLPYNKFQERFGKEEELAPTDVDLLTDIRDILARDADGNAGGGNHSA